MKYFRQGLFLSFLAFPAVGIAGSNDTEFNEKVDPVVIVTNPVQSMKRVTESKKVTGWTLTYIVDDGSLDMTIHPNIFKNMKSCNVTAKDLIDKVSLAMSVKVTSFCTPIYDITKLTGVLYQRVK